MHEGKTPNCSGCRLRNISGQQQQHEERRLEKRKQDTSEVKRRGRRVAAGRAAEDAQSSREVHQATQAQHDGTHAAAQEEAIQRRS